MPSLHHNLFSKHLARKVSTASPSSYETDWPLVLKRIQLLATALIGLFFFEMSIGLIISRLHKGYFDQQLESIPFVAATVLLSILLLVITKFVHMPANGLRAVCITYVFSIAILISITDIRIPWWEDGGRLHGMPWATMWLLLVPVVVPLGHRRGMGRSILLSVVPVSVMFVGIRWFGLPPASAITYLDLYLPCMIASILAVIIARMMYQLTSQVKKAQTMGSYQLEEQIGAGGMGEVWRAKHQMLVRPAAIKLVRTDRMAKAANTQSDSVVSRFKREAQATASLRSPHTVELYDFGVADDGTFFYVMELLDGLDLAKFVERFGPLAPERVVYLLHQMCCSLADAHSSGLVHRDIKPANIYVCRMGMATDFVKILDFGLVKSLGADQTNLTLTADQAVIGTPAFLSPEAIAGKSNDPRLDIYSLGCVAYWLLTGVLVFETESALAMAVAHAKEDPVPPSQKSELAIPKELDKVILDCLAKNPADRPQSAMELSIRLGQCQFKEPWTAYQASRWWDRHLPASEQSHVLTGQKIATQMPSNYLGNSGPQV